MAGDGIKTERRRPKRAWKSKTMWFNAVVAAVGAVEAAAPGTIPAGPVMLGISVMGAVLRSMTTGAVR